MDVVASVIFSLCALMCSCIHPQCSNASVLGQPDLCKHCVWGWNVCLGIARFLPLFTVVCGAGDR